MRISSWTRNRPLMATCALLALSTLILGYLTRVAVAEKVPMGVGAQTVARIAGNPLTIAVSSASNIQVYYAGQTGGQFFPSGSDLANHGIFLWVNNAVYGPFLGTYFTEVSQTGPTGNGTAGSPWLISTTVRAGTTGIQVVENVSYVNGQQYFRIDSQIVNTATVTTTLSYFHAGDLYLQGSDDGYGYYNQATGGVGGYNQAQNWYIVLQPVTPATKYEEDDYSTIWAHISSNGQPGPGFDNSINPSFIDNGAGLQWSNITLAPAQSTTVSSWVSFGTAPVSVPSATATTGVITTTVTPSPTPTRTPTATATSTPVPPPAPPPPPPPPPTITPGVPLVPGVVYGQISPNTGGVIDGYKEGVRITFPPGAVSGPVNVTYQVVSPPASAPPVNGVVYFTLEAFGPTGSPVTQFGAEFEICVKNANGLVYFDGQKWIEVPVTLTADGACGRLNHLTLFAVVVNPTPTPAARTGPGAAGVETTPEPGQPVTTAPTPGTAPAATPTAGGPTVPSRLPSTGDPPPLGLLLALAAAAAIAGLVLRRASKA